MKIEKSYTKSRAKHERDAYYDLFMGVETYNHQDCKISHLSKYRYEEVSERGILSTLLRQLQKSPTGLALVREAGALGWTISLEDLEESADYTIDVSMQHIKIDTAGLDPEGLTRSTYFMNNTLISLIKVLRDVWHEKRQGGFENLFSPDAILMLERIRSADLDVISVLVAWEMRSEGENDFWRYLIGSENGDLAMMYSKILEKETADTSGKKALQGVFKQWFDDQDRVNDCDNRVLNYLDDLIEVNPEEHVFGSKHPTHVAIELLSCMPDKTAYLLGMGEEILRDPRYSGMQNTINQTHLMHIMHDMHATYVGNVAFRDANLAAKFFPSEKIEEFQN